ncbi:MAG: hypothetical protein ABSG53_25000, partial [Thermoguttaceae bacterium]
TLGDSKAETSPTSDSTSSSSIQDYYRYRYEPIDGQYGSNQNAATEENAAPSNNDSISTQNSDDSTANSDEESDDETASDTDRSVSSPMADAMLAVVSRWAEDFASNYGLKLSQVMGLLGQIK